MFWILIILLLIFFGDQLAVDLIIVALVVYWLFG